ncbi:hypothetical protein BMEII0658 [Brucella melitensis bv. 1 str. 16M]|uniref:DUF3572 family protein n=1 Tax=Brucella melitensis biotype 1 (strain ATCC 23456 / CCUG 17765 / NCTC 10094 / 16M) TaxID=224914 RepID=Q8YC74_BRUME|nr:hypothetical protein BMEII0658 [Brucella melitensis bv. 1 str. 16M]
MAVTTRHGTKRRERKYMKKLMSEADAQGLAIEALAWLAQDKDLLPRFLALTGIEASSIRQAAREPGFLAGVLQFFLGHEPTLIRFCEETGHDPALFEKAVALLPGGFNQHL